MGVNLLDFIPYLSQQIAGLEPVRPYPAHAFDEPIFPHNYYCAVLDKEHTVEYGTALDETAQAAQTKAIAEALERWSSRTAQHRHRLIAYKFSSQTKKALDPVAFVKTPRFCTAQYAEQLREASIQWCEATHFLSGERLLIPAQAVFWDYPFYGKEPLIQVPTTNGTAFHMNFEAAFQGAVCEAIERDAQLLHWLSGKEGIHIDIGEDEKLLPLKQYIASFGLKLHLLNIMVDTAFPVVAAAVIDERPARNPAVSVGTACADSFATAIQKAIYGVMKSRNWIALEFQRKYEPIDDISRAMSFKQRAFYWANPQRIADLHFWTQSKQEQSLKDLAKYTVQDAKKLIQEKCGDLYWVDLTTPALERIGAQVIKVIQPHWLSPYFQEQFNCMNSERLRVFCDEHGCTPMLRAHPFL